jgi:hypothetical protein
MLMEKNKKVVVKTKKVNEKDIAKDEIMAIIRKALEENGIKYKDGVDYGMTRGTIIVEHEKADVQIKPITPKAGLTRYQEVVIVEE